MLVELFLIRTRTAAGVMVPVTVMIRWTRVMALGPKLMQGRLLVRREVMSVPVLLSLGTLVEMTMLLTGALDVCPPGMTLEGLNRRP